MENRWNSLNITIEIQWYKTHFQDLGGLYVLQACMLRHSSSIYVRDGTTLMMLLAMLFMVSCNVIYRYYYGTVLVSYMCLFENGVHA